MAAFRGVINFTFLFFVELFLWKNSYICKYEDILIDKYFETLYSAGVKVGQIKTCLGVRGQEKNGPKDAALELFDIIKSIK